MVVCFDNELLRAPMVVWDMVGRHGRVGMVELAWLGRHGRVGMVG